MISAQQNPYEAGSFEIAGFGRPVDLHEHACTSSSNLPVLSVALGRGAQISCSNNLLSIWIVERGSMQANIAGHVVPICKGQMLVCSETPVKLVSIGDSACIGVSIASSEGPDSKYFFPELSVQTYVDEADAKTASFSRRLLLAAEAGLQPEKSDYIEFASRLFSAESKAASELSECPGRTNQLRRSAYQRLSKARLYIATNPSHIESVSELSAIANYSDSYFIRTFSDVFQEPPMKYAQRMRMLHAKNLIKERRLSLLEISRELGFVTFSAFCRSFRLETGFTPSLFRDMPSAGQGFKHTEAAFYEHQPGGN